MIAACLIRVATCLTVTTAQGILNYNGPNTLAVSLWAADAGGAKLNSLALQVTSKAESTLEVANVPMPAWAPRPGAY